MAPIIIGFNGTVGRYCTQYLQKHNYTPIFSGRDSNNDAIIYCDLDDKTTWENIFLTIPFPGSTVINCAGPSYRYSQELAKEIISHDHNYIDIGGDQELINFLDPLAKNHKVSAIIGAGIQPGIAASAIKILYEKTKSSSIEICCGGLQTMTRAGLKDYIHSVLARIGNPQCEIIDYHLHKLLSPVDPKVALGFSANSSYHPCIDEEVVYLAKQLNIPNIRWFNVMSSQKIESGLGKFMADILSQEEVLEVFQQEIADQEPYFRVLATALDAEISLMLSCKNSYLLSGTAAGMAYRYKTHRQFGAYWFSDVIDSSSLWDELKVLPQTDMRWLDQKQSVSCSIWDEGEI